MTAVIARHYELAKKVEVLSNVVQQMMQTGLFNMQLMQEMARYTLQSPRTT